MTKIRKRASVVCFYCLGWAFASGHLFAQEYASLPDAPDYARAPITAGPPSRTPQDEEGQKKSSPVDTTTGVVQRQATWHSLPGDILHDQKDLWSFPIKVVQGHHLLPTAIVLGGTAGLIYADPHAVPYFRTHQKNWDDVNDVFDPMIATNEVIALPAALMISGYIRHDDREVNTALLAGEAYTDSVVINLALKVVTRRERPSEVPPNGNVADTFFDSNKLPFSSSFPSAHATAVWSVATVVAEHYRHRGKPWIPVLSYTLATAISLSRISETAHFPSDVWLGAALGYTIAKYQTLRPR